LILPQEITFKIDFQKLFRVGYAFTIHACQGMSIETPYTIHEWERMHKKLKYVALSPEQQKRTYKYYIIYIIYGLETLYKKFNFPASSTFLKLLKNEGLKYTKDEVDKFIKGRTEQQQTTIKTEKKKDLGKIVSFYPLSLFKWIFMTWLNITEKTKDINIFYVLPMFIAEKYGLIK
jgi:hypothetical protein